MKNLIKKRLKLNNQGFTVVETLIAITILLIAVVGPMEIASKGLFGAYYARDQITSYYLAQEGLEFVRSFKDADFLYANNSGVYTDNWMDVFEDSGCFGPNGCEVDVAYPGIQSCGAQCSTMVLDKNTDIFSINPSADTEDVKFRRRIRMNAYSAAGAIDNSDITNAQEVLVESTVSWEGPGLFSSKSFTLSERIFNHKINYAP